MGLGLICGCSAECIIQLNPAHCDEQYLYLNNLLLALENDHDVVLLPSQKLERIFTNSFYYLRMPIMYPILVVLAKLPC